MGLCDICRASYFFVKFTMYIMGNMDTTLNMNNFKEEIKMKEILEAMLEDYEDRNGERDYETERKVSHGTDDELFELLAEFGYQ